MLLLLVLLLLLPLLLLPLLLLPLLLLPLLLLPRLLLPLLLLLVDFTIWSTHHHPNACTLSIACLGAPEQPLQGSVSRSRQSSMLFEGVRGDKGRGEGASSLEPLLRERSSLQSAHKAIDSVLRWVGSLCCSP